MINKHPFIIYVLINRQNDDDDDFVKAENMGIDILTKPLLSAKHYKYLR